VIAHARQDTATGCPSWRRSGRALRETASALQIAVMIVSMGLSRTPPWSGVRKPLLWLANLNWIAVVLLFVTLIVMMVTYKQAGGDMTTPPKLLPLGVIGLVGYANRLVRGVNYSCRSCCLSSGSYPASSVRSHREDSRC
jgi:hypothetical protein